MQNKLILVNFDATAHAATRYRELLANRNIDFWTIGGERAHDLQPHHVLSLIDQKWGRSELEGSRLTLATNSVEFLSLMYRLYHQTFDNFIYVESDVTDDSKLDSVYHRILSVAPVKDERLWKCVYVLGSPRTILFTDNIRDIHDFGDIRDNGHAEPNVQKYYMIDGKYWAFEPMSGDAVVIVVDPTPETVPLSYFHTVFQYEFIDLSETRGLLQRLNNTNADAIFVRDHSEYQRVFQQLARTVSEAGHFRRRFYECALLLLSASIPHRSVRLYILSFLTEAISCSDYLSALLEEVISDTRLSKEQKFFLVYQCSRYVFVNNRLTDESNARLLRQLYRDIYREYVKEFSEYEYIPKEQRDKDLVIVITSQILSLGHAPTKTALDRAYHLMKMGKRVLLINTKEVLSIKEVVPFHNVTIPNQIRELEQEHNLRYKDVDIGFYQCGVEMPDVNEIRGILNMIARNKPYFVMGIGSLNLTADLCSKMVPTLTVPLGFSALPITESQFHLASVGMPASEWELFREFGFDENNIVQSVFTFDFKPQEHVYSREQLNLPVDQFLLAVIGGRLDYEVTDAFIEMLLSTKHTHTVFVGRFRDYERFADRYPALRERSTYMGLQEDVLAILELCDLYVNPERLGGGSSVAEAMYKGVPAVTLGTGDVSVNTGQEFWVDSYEQMQLVIEKYRTDWEFYSLMSSRAAERAKILMGTQRELERVIREMEQLPLFK